MKKLPWRKLGRFVERTLACAGVFFIVFHVFFEASEFTTGSMAPLLNGEENGRPDTALIEKRFTAGRVPARFQVVAFRNDEGIDVAKRVVGLPGETVQVLRDRTLLIDGKKVAAPEGVGDGRGYLPCGNLWDGHAYQVPPGHVYVLGDDTKDSFDSRFTGGLAVERIRGRVLFRIWPLDRLKCLFA